jgi:hypothetical protein
MIRLKMSEFKRFCAGPFSKREFAYLTESYRARRVPTDDEACRAYSVTSPAALPQLPSRIGDGIIQTVSVNVDGPL